jgi:hypothetical protein
MAELSRLGLNKFFINVILSVVLSSCSNGTLRTPEDIPRKVVISNKDGAISYEDDSFTKRKSEYKQWEVFFILERNEKYIKVSKDLDNKSNVSVRGVNEN